MVQLASCIKHAVTRIQLILRAFQEQDDAVSTVISLTTISYKSIFLETKISQINYKSNLYPVLKK